MSDALDSLDAFEPREMTEPASPVAASTALDGDEPVLGPLGRLLVVVLVVVLAAVFIVASVWLLGYLAYTTPPVPGGG